MNIALWVVAILLAGMYAFAGFTKATQPKEKLTTQMAWVEDFSAGTVRFIGVVEVLGAIGLILPEATDVAPVLTPLAATGLVLIQLGAIPTHIRRGEAKVLPVNVALLALAAFVAIGRFVN